MEYRSAPRRIPILKTNNMCPKTPARGKDCVLRLLLPKPDNDGGHQKSHILLPQKQTTTFETTLMPVAKLQDSKRELKTEDLRKRRQAMRSFVNCNPKQSKILPVLDVNMLEEELEDANLLPSKKDDKKSEITLVPVKPKVCGCSGPCEIITCEVIVQHYMDEDEMSLMLAMNIEQDEIDACVTKHCENTYCDAVSIDHDRCRRGFIELHRCDQLNVCDICRTPMESWKSRVYHKRCERKNEYRHNNVSPERLLRDRLRLRELQILETLRIRKNDYLDPINGHALALETLRNNKELVITTKTALGQKQALIITAIPSVATTSASQSVVVDSKASNVKRVIGNMIAIPFHSNAASSPNGASSSLREGATQQTGPTQFTTSAPQSAYIVTTSNTACRTVIPASQAQYIRLPNSSPITVQPTTINNLILTRPQVVTSSSGDSELSSTTVKPVTINNLILSQPRVVTNPSAESKPSSSSTTVKPITINSLIAQPQVGTKSSAQSKPVLAPIRVMPITNLKTAPSLLHRQQGLPRFCVMAGNMITTLTVPNVQALQPIIAANITAQEQVSKVQVSTSKASPAPPTHHKRHIIPQKRVFHRKPSKQFFCVYCEKYLSTDWYFRKHVLKHLKANHIPKASAIRHSERFSKKSQTSEKCDAKEEHEHDYACDSPYSSVKSLADRMDSESEELRSHIKQEHDIEYCDENFADETNSCITGGLNQVERKEIKCEEEMPDTWEKNVEIFKNGIKIEAQDEVYFEEVSLEDPDVEEFSLFNENSNAKENKFVFVPVEENVNPECFEEEEDVNPLR